MTNTDQDLARAQALGRAAARAKQRVTTCPYSSKTADGRALRYLWVMAYAGAGGRQGVETTTDKLRGAIKRAWHGKKVP